MKTKTTIHKLIQTLSLLTMLAAQTASGFYDPNLQRWLTLDPIGEAGGINLYQFVGNDPVNKFDPDGLQEVFLEPPPSWRIQQMPEGGYTLYSPPDPMEHFWTDYTKVWYSQSVQLLPVGAVPGRLWQLARFGVFGEKCLAKGVPTRQWLMLGKNTGYNISPASWFTKYSTLGRQGTFLTDYKAVAKILGPVRANQSFKVGWFTSQGQVSYWKVWRLERALGLERGSLRNGFRFTRVSNLHGKSPRSPLVGNQYFQGPGKGLPGGGPELVVEPIPTAP